MERKCPKCGSENVVTERRPKGDSKCLSCGHKDMTIIFDGQLTENGKLIGLSLEAKLKVAVEAALAYRQLSVCYRIGKQPTENLFKELVKANKLLEENEKIKAK